ncbi:7326_t:CDS:2, partial [Racocetra persica]
MFSTKVVEQETSSPNMASEVVSNPEYHKPRGRPSKQLKSSVEEHNEHHTSFSKICSYCSGKGHNIRGCSKYKSDLANKENH